MGDRVSIQFVNGDEKSVVLFSHWGGMDFVEEAKVYINILQNEKHNFKGNPLGRLEPNTVMVDFIRHLVSNIDNLTSGRVMSDLYLGATEEDGDNSDNGHFEIQL